MFLFASIRRHTRYIGDWSSDVCSSDLFPEDVYRAPETWARRAYHNLIYFNEVDKGGHFAAWEQPEIFSAELRAAFRSLQIGRASCREKGSSDVLPSHAK